MQPIIENVGVSLWRLLPGNPIVVRVVQGGSKRAQHFWARAGYLLILFFVVLIMQLYYSDQGGSTLTSQAKNAARVFEGVAVLQLAMMCLLAPVFTAGAISQEKDAETFNVLLTTPLTNAQIVLGSLMSRLFFVLMLLLSGLPIFGITMLYGGVTSQQILLSFGIAACTAVVTGALAILVSIMRVGTRGTIFSFYMGIAIFLLAGLALGLWSKTHVPESIAPGETEGMSFIAPLHPFLALAVALDWIHPPEAVTVEHYFWPLDRMLAAPAQSYMVVTLLASVVMVALATLFVRRGAKLGEPTLWSRLLPRRGGRTADGERTRRARRVWANPVAWREAVTRASVASSGFARYGYLIGAGAAGLMLIVAYMTRMLTPVEARDWLTGIVLIEFATVMLMAANTAATAITREREAGTMELLLSTPLTSRYIIWGKIRGLVSFTVPLMAVPAATVLLMALFDLLHAPDKRAVSIVAAIVVPPLLLTYGAFAAIVALHMSLKSRRSVQAVLASVGLLIGLGFGLGVCAYSALGGTSQLGALMAPMTMFTSIYIALNPEFVMDMRNRGMSVSMADIHLFLAVGTILAVGIYSAIVAGVYKSMVTNFDMIVRKQSR